MTELLSDKINNPAGESKPEPNPEIDNVEVKEPISNKLPVRFSEVKTEEPKTRLLMDAILKKSFYLVLIQTAIQMKIVIWIYS